MQNHRSKLFAILAALPVSLLGLSLSASAVTWTGLGADGLFSTTANWDNDPVGVVGGEALVLGIDGGPAPHYFAPDLGGPFLTPSITFLSGATAYLMQGATASDELTITSTGTAILNQSSNRQTSNLLNINVGVSTQTWDGGAGGLSIYGIDLGNNRSLTLTGTGASVGSRNEITFGIVGTGLSGGVVKQGAGTLLYSGVNTYTGSTRVSAGTLLLGANERILNTSNVILDGGTLNTGGFDETVGKLSLTNFSTIDFGAGNTSDLVFSLSSDQAWGAFTLNITNFNVGLDTLRFGTNSSGLTAAQLSTNIRFNGTTAGQIDSSGFVTAVPEPSSVFLIGLGLASLFARRRSGR